MHSPASGILSPGPSTRSWALWAKGRPMSSSHFSAQGLTHKRHRIPVTLSPKKASNLGWVCRTDLQPHCPSLSCERWSFSGDYKQEVIFIPSFLCHPGNFNPTHSLLLLLHVSPLLSLVAMFTSSFIYILINLDLEDYGSLLLVLPSTLFFPLFVHPFTHSASAE